MKEKYKIDWSKAPKPEGNITLIGHSFDVLGIGWFHYIVPNESAMTIYSHRSGLKKRKGLNWSISFIHAPRKK